MLTRTARFWRAAAVSLWLIWAGHVYFDAYLFRCIATFVLALLATIPAVIMTVEGDSKC